MGNRALIVPKDNERIGVYLHWNGGINSVTALLKYCELKGYRSFGGKNGDSYGIARFTQVVGNFFGGGLSLGIVSVQPPITKEFAANYDNGVYIIDGWEISRRITSRYYNDNYNVDEMLLDIDAAQPEEEQLGKTFITAEVVDASELQIGDKVAILDTENHSRICEVVSLKWDRIHMLDSPVINYLNDGSPENPNNILSGNVRRVKEENA